MNDENSRRMFIKVIILDKVDWCVDFIKNTCIKVSVNPIVKKIYYSDSMNFIGVIIQNTAIPKETIIENALFIFWVLKIIFT